MLFRDIFEEIERTGRDFVAEKAALFQRTLAVLEECLRAGRKILVFGNGGSASQAQHFAAELVNRFFQDRSALAALALTTDSSALTSIANDTAFEFVFSRQIEALGKSGDVALGLSTSGNSSNMLRAFQTAGIRGIKTIALTGSGGGKLAELSDILLDVPSEVTPRVQEIHLVLLHILAEELESRLGGGA